jgi:hypothetical protein
LHLLQQIREIEFCEIHFLCGSRVV